MATQIHFVRRDQDLAVEEEPQAIAAAASGSSAVRATAIDRGIIFVNWANVLSIEEVPKAMTASGT